MTYSCILRTATRWFRPLTLATAFAGSLALSAADLSSDYTWRPVRIGAGGLVTSILSHPLDTNVRYVRTDVGGAYRWDSSSNEWVQMVRRLNGQGLPASVASVTANSSGVEAIAIDPSNTNIVYMALPLGTSQAIIDGGLGGPTPGSVYRSTDGGRNFTKGDLAITMAPNGNHRTYGERMFVDPNATGTIYYGSLQQGLWRSTNSGANWSQVSGNGAPATNANVIGVRIYDAGTSSVIYAIVFDGDVYRSTNGGTNWTNISSGSGISGGATISTLDHLGRLWVVKNNSNQVFRWNGSSWAQFFASVGQNLQAIAVDPNDANGNRLYGLGWGGGIGRSLDGGANWTQLSEYTVFNNTLGWLPQPLPGWHGTTNIIFDANSVLWISQGNEGVLTFTPSSNNSESPSNPPKWNIVSQGIEEMVTHQVIVPKGGGGRAYAAFHDTSAFMITNADTFTAKWNNLQDQLIVNGTSVAAVPDVPSKVVVSASDINNTFSGNNFSGFTTNSGDSWQFFGSRPKELQCGFIAISRRNGRAASADRIVMLPGKSRAPHYSHDGGNTWNKAATFTESVNEWGATVIDNYTAFWDLSLKQHSVMADPFVQDRFYLKFVDGGFWRSNDGGVNWTLLDNTDLPQGTHHGQLAMNYNVQNDIWFAAGWEGPYDPETWTWAGANGLWHSTDGGDNWQKVSGPEYAITLALGAGRGQAGDASYTVYFFGKLAGDSAFGTFRSTNAGASWDRISGLPMGLVDTVTCMGASWDTFSQIYIGFVGTSLVYGSTNGTPPPATVATPTFSPAGGTYSSAQSVTISTTTSGATIRYTTNGTNPTSTSGTVYSGPVNISATTTLKAIAYKSGSTDSSVATATYTISTGGGDGTPYSGSAISLPGRVEAENYNNGGSGVAYNDTDTGNNGGALRSDNVDIEATGDTGGGHNIGWTAAGEWLKYTVNVSTAGSYKVVARVASDGGSGSFTVRFNGGSAYTVNFTGTGGWQTYTNIEVSGITLSAGQQVMRVDCTSGGFNLNYIDVLANGGTTTVATPTFSPAAGTYTSAQSVTISTTTASSTIRYTTDGSNPTSTSGTVYSGPVNISATTTLKAIAYRSGWTDSSVTTGAYTINTGSGGGNLRLEAESATLVGVSIGTSPSGFSGTGFIEASTFDSGSDSITFNFNVTTGGSYEVRIGYRGFNGDKYQNVRINSGSDEYVSFPSTSGFTYLTLGNRTFNTGSNTVVIWPSWGWSDIDYLEIVGAGGGSGSAPAAPALQGVTQASPITLTWSNVSGETGYDIDRKVGTASWAFLASVGANVTSYQDTGATTNGTVYCYRVRAKNGTLFSGYSQILWTVKSAANNVGVERWTGISGTAVSAIPVSTAPASGSTINQLETSQSSGDNYGVRIRGYIVAPTTGSYTFWVAGDDDCELWLSTNDQPSTKSRIAYFNGWTTYRQWNKYTTQKSAARTLTAGQKYYFEVLHKEGTGSGDCVSVGWAKPSQSTSAPSQVIPGAQLAPY